MRNYVHLPTLLAYLRKAADAIKLRDVFLEIFECFISPEFSSVLLEIKTLMERSTL
jgi:hypothetical protein